MAPAEEVFGGIALHFQRLNMRRCDEFWASGGGYGYHGQTHGVVRECLVRLLMGMEFPSKYALLLLTNQKVEYVRCDGRSIFF